MQHPYSEGQLNNLERLIELAYKHEERGGSEKGLKWILYTIGVQAFRNYYEVGPAADVRHPGLQQPRKIFDPNSRAFVDERQMIASTMKRAAEGGLEILWSRS